jgi:hypothetical protein
MFYQKITFYFFIYFNRLRKQQISEFISVENKGFLRGLAQVDKCRRGLRHPRSRHSAIRRDITFGLVVVWALVGIAVKQKAVPSIVYTAIIGAVIMAAALVAVVLRSKMKTSEKE